MVSALEGSELQALLCEARAAVDAGDVATAISLLDPLCNAHIAEALYLRSGISLPGENLHDFQLRRVAQLEQAAQLSCVEALYVLGTCLESGEDVPEDPQRAIELFREAARHGHPHAMWRLGLMTLYGTKQIQKNEDEGLRLIKEAADLQSEGALKTIANFYRDGLFGFERNVEEAERLIMSSESSSVLRL